MPVRLLALETSGLVGSLALAVDDRVLTHVTLDARRRTTEALTPAIQQQLAAVGWTPRDLNVIAVTRGPGSFTGLRIGLVTAKVLAYATGAALVGIDTHAAIAEQVPADAEQLDTVLDAQRQQLFVARWRRDRDDRWQPTDATQIVDATRWIEQLVLGQIVSGPGLVRISAQLPSSVRVAPPESWAPTAATIATLGWRSFIAGQRDDPWTLAPTYMRPSAAEEKAASTT